MTQSEMCASRFASLASCVHGWRIHNPHRGKHGVGVPVES